ncbi:unnamed protein product [Parnassius mnemosyne]|uniref:G-protein coupled receptors family 1 profile domain-containing protein n=1 Tax=Parnassius mnemosyne TaxID=213953 RepID=A0AAV1M227_9NEOP
MSNITEAHNEFDIHAWAQFITKSREVEPPWSATVFISFVYIITITGILENVLTCAVIYNDKTMHTSTNFYLFNLAVSDLIVTFTVLLGAPDYFEYGQWTCKVHYFFIVVLWNNSVLTITVLSIERYMAIWYPLQFQLTPMWRRVLKIITAIWIMAILETIPELWTVDLVKLNRSSICSTVPTPTARVIHGFLGLITFLIPLAIMTFVYIMIALKVNITQKSNTSNKIFNHHDNRRKLNKLVIILTLSYLLCWMPFFMMRVLLFALENYQLMALEKWWSLGQRVIYINSYFSVVLNPIIFSLISTKFRESLKRLWVTNIKKRKLNIAVV